MGQYINLELIRGNKTRDSIRSITITAMLLAVLVAQEQVLVFIPQFQFTFILVVVYSQFLRYRQLIPLIIAYVLIDNVSMAVLTGAASFNPMYVVPMMISWLLISIVSRSLRNSPDYVSFIWIILASFLYSWSFIPANMIMMSNFKVLAYLIIDIPWEIALAIINAGTFLVLYTPLTTLFKNYVFDEDEVLIYDKNRL